MGLSTWKRFLDFWGTYLDILGFLCSTYWELYLLLVYLKTRKHSSLLQIRRKWKQYLMLPWKCSSRFFLFSSTSLRFHLCNCFCLSWWSLCIHLVQDENRRADEREWLGNKYLIHFFDYETNNKKYMIWGLTAGILIRAASIVYQRPPPFVEQNPSHKLLRTVDKHSILP